jgi:hypothetical protein
LRLSKLPRGLLELWLLLAESMVDSILLQVCINMDKGLDLASNCNKR